MRVVVAFSCLVLTLPFAAAQPKVDTNQRTFETTLSMEERHQLEKLRQHGEAVFWIGSRVCLSELYYLFEEKAESAAWLSSRDGEIWRYSVEPTVEMHARYENDMFFAQERIEVIGQSCDGKQNHGDLQMAKRFLERTERACRAIFASCEAIRHW